MAKIPINSSSGVLSFATAPDYEMQSTYTVTITVSDGNPGASGTNSTTQEITITINDLDDVSTTCVYDQDNFNIGLEFIKSINSESAIKS